MSTKHQLLAKMYCIFFVVTYVLLSNATVSSALQLDTTPIGDRITNLTYPIANSHWIARQIRQQLKKLSAATFLHRVNFVQLSQSVSRYCEAVILYVFETLTRSKTYWRYRILCYTVILRAVTIAATLGKTPAYTVFFIEPFILRVRLMNGRSKRS